MGICLISLLILHDMCYNHFQFSLLKRQPFFALPFHDNIIYNLPIVAYVHPHSILSIPLVSNSQNKILQNLHVPHFTMIFIHIILFLLTILEVLLINLVRLLLLKIVKCMILIIILAYLMSNICP